MTDIKHAYKLLIHAEEEELFRYPAHAPQSFEFRLKKSFKVLCWLCHMKVYTLWIRGKRKPVTQGNPVDATLLYEVSTVCIFFVCYCQLDGFTS